MTSVLPYNDVAAAERFFKKTKDLAGVIVEPVAANMGVVPATPGFLETLKKGAARSGALLIFDEVISGFRLRYGGAQHLYGISPDLTVLGKVIGGGLPVGAFGGAKRFMDHLVPNGAVYQAGTLSGNPLSMVAGQSVLSALNAAFYSRLNARTEDFVDQMRTILTRRGHTAAVQSVGSMFTVFFGKKKVWNFTDVQNSDKEKFRRFFRHMIQRGVYVPPSAFEASFVSAAHGEHELKKTLEVVRQF